MLYFCSIPDKKVTEIIAVVTEELLRRQKSKETAALNNFAKQLSQDKVDTLRKQLYDQQV